MQSVKHNTSLSLSPAIKIAATFSYIIITLSFPNTSVLHLLAFSSVIIFCSLVAELNLAKILLKSLIALPFVLFIGIANIYYSSSTACTFLGYAITTGTLSAIVLAEKAILTVSAAIILTQTTSTIELARGFATFKIPCSVVLQFLMTIRYIPLIAKEALSIKSAYTLRTGNSIPKFSHWHMLAGSLLLRTLDHAGKIYNAMLIRGFDAGCNRKNSLLSPASINGKDILFFCIFLSACFALRLLEIYKLFDIFAK